MSAVSVRVWGLLEVQVGAAIWQIPLRGNQRASKTFVRLALPEPRVMGLAMRFAAASATRPAKKRSGGATAYRPVWPHRSKTASAGQAPIVPVVSSDPDAQPRHAHSCTRAKSAHGDCRLFSTVTPVIAHGIESSPGNFLRIRPVVGYRFADSRGVLPDGMAESNRKEVT